MANAYEIKKVLEDIIYHAYYGKVPEETYKRLTTFYVAIENKILKTFHAYYYSDKHLIRIMNLYRERASLVMVSVHELAHHADYILNFSLSHGKSFYKEYELLLFTALNMGLFTIEELRTRKYDTMEHNKVQRILARYRPEPIEYKKEEKRIVVRNCFSVKDLLKENGFRYNALSSTWEKVVPTSDVESLTDMLSGLDCNFEVLDGNTVKIEAIGFLIAGEGSYEHRDALKAAGFLWNSDKKRWQKKIQMQNYNDEIEGLEELRGLVPIKLERARR